MASRIHEGGGTERNDAVSAMRGKWGDRMHVKAPSGNLISARAGLRYCQVGDAWLP